MSAESLPSPGFDARELDALASPAPDYSVASYVGALWVLRWFVLEDAKARLYARLGSSYLGRAWLVLEPLLYLGIYFFVFGLALRDRDEFGGQLATISAAQSRGVSPPPDVVGAEFGFSNREQALVGGQTEFTPGQIIACEFIARGIESRRRPLELRGAATQCRRFGAIDEVAAVEIVEVQKLQRGGVEDAEAGVVDGTDFSVAACGCSGAIVEHRT